MLNVSFVEASAMSVVCQLRSLSEPKQCLPGRPVYFRKLPAAELAWLASRLP
jgi:hypothetical protein